MGESERCGDLVGDGGGALGLHRAGQADEVGDRVTVDELHDDEVGARLGAPVVHAGDVGMGQVGRGLGLPTEPLDEGRVGGELREEHLDRDHAVQREVAGQVDLGHSAAGDLALDLVAAAQQGGHRV